MIALVGAGAMGGMLAARLNAAGYEVTLVGRIGTAGEAN